MKLDVFGLFTLTSCRDFFAPEIIQIVNSIQILYFHFFLWSQIQDDKKNIFPVISL